MTLHMLAAMRARLQAARVMVVGDAMLDRYWVGSDERISPEAPVPVVRVTARRSASAVR
jgi:bifunctional ADP-heptose synthase (sugar kinase/adenylyltransferase)